MGGKASATGRGMGNVSDKGPNIVISFSIAGSGAESERRKSAKNKWKPVIMIRVKWPPPPYQKVEVLNTAPSPVPPSPKTKKTRRSHHTHGGVRPTSRRNRTKLVFVLLLLGEPKHRTRQAQLPRRPLPIRPCSTTIPLTRRGSRRRPGRQ